MIKKQKKILIIEDDTEVRELYREALKEAGFKVAEAADGEEGLDKAKKGGYGLILLDLMMPKLDGLALLVSLKKKSPKVKNGPVVLLTNLSPNGATQKAFKLGVKEILIKTDFKPDQLVEKVKSLLK